MSIDIATSKIAFRVFFSWKDGSDLLPMKNVANRLRMLVKDTGDPATLSRTFGFFGRHVSERIAQLTDLCDLLLSEENEE